MTGLFALMAVDSSPDQLVNFCLALIASWALVGGSSDSSD